MTYSKFAGFILITMRASLVNSLKFYRYLYNLLVGFFKFGVQEKLTE
jgi:hypothetical protein